MRPRASRARRAWAPQRGSGSPSLQPSHVRLDVVRLKAQVMQTAAALQVRRDGVPLRSDGYSIFVPSMGKNAVEVDSEGTSSRPASSIPRSSTKRAIAASMSGTAMAMWSDGESWTLT